MGLVKDATKAMTRNHAPAAAAAVEDPLRGAALGAAEVGAGGALGALGLGAGGQVAARATRSGALGSAAPDGPGGDEGGGFAASLRGLSSGGAAGGGSVGVGGGTVGVGGSGGSTSWRDRVEAAAKSDASDSGAAKLGKNTLSTLLGSASAGKKGMGSKDKDGDTHWKSKDFDPKFKSTGLDTFHDWGHHEDILDNGVDGEGPLDIVRFGHTTADLHDDGMAGKVQTDGDVKSGAYAAKGEASAGSEAYVSGGAYANGFDCPEAWMNGDRASAGGSFRAGTKAEAKASGELEGGFGPQLGAIDPETGERANVVNTKLHGDAYASHVNEVGADGEVYVEGMSAGAAGKVFAEQLTKAGASAGTETNVGVGDLEIFSNKTDASVEASRRIGASAEGEIEVGPGGFFAAGKAETEAMIRAKGKVATKNTYGGILDVSMGAEGAASAGANANAVGAVGAGPKAMGAAGKASAFAGAKVEGSATKAVGSSGVDFVSGTVGGELKAGAGAGAGGGLIFRDGKLTISAELMAAAGVGGSLSGSVTIDLLAPFKVVLNELEKNGILSADPAKWIPQIVGYSTGALAVGQAGKALGGGGLDDGVEADDDGSFGEDVDDAIDSALGLGSGSSSLALISDAVRSAGGEVGTDGAIEMVGAEADPLALRGQLPGELGTKHDEAVGEASSRLSDAYVLMHEARTDANTAITGAMDTLMESLSDPVEMFEYLLQTAMKAIGSIVEAGIASAVQLVGGVAKAAVQTMAAVARLMGALVKAIFGEVTGMFDGYKDDSKDLSQMMLQESADLRQGIDAIEVDKIKSPKDAFIGALMGVAGDFARRAGHDIDGAGDKAAEARSLIESVQDEPMDLGVGQGSFEVEDEALEDAGEVCTALEKLGGPAVKQAKGNVESAGDITKVADDAGGTAREAKSVGPSEMGQTFKGPKASEDARIAKEEADTNKKLDEVRGDPFKAFAYGVAALFGG